MFVLMKKLVVALSKLVVDTVVPEPGTTVLTCLIDFATAQESATQTSLVRIEGKIDDIHQNPFRLGTRILMDAGKVSNPKLRRERIQRALDAFTQAAEYTRLGDPLLALKARLSAGACYDLLQERQVALDHYEEVFRTAKDLEKLARQKPDTPEDMDLLERVGYWFDSREPDYKEKQQLIVTLRENKAELKDFIEHLLQLILKRKGVSREEYLKPWTPPKKERLPKPLSALAKSHFLSTPKLLSGYRSPLGSSYNFMICPKCGKTRTFDTCPVCHGTKKVGIVACTRCGGRGTTLICDCDRGVNLLSNRTFQFDPNRCLFCGGKGEVTYDNGKTWLKCFHCGGTGRRKKWVG